VKREQTELIDKLMILLVSHKLMSHDDAKALHKSFVESDIEQFDDFLLEEGLIDENALLNILSELYELPAFDVVDHFFDTTLLRKFPKDFLLRLGIIPLDIAGRFFDNNPEYKFLEDRVPFTGNEAPIDDESTLIIVASNPADQNLLIEIGKFVSYDIEFCVGIRRYICDAVKEFYDTALTVGVEPDLYDETENLEKDAVELEAAKSLHNEDLD
jgi:Type II secretion system (T2SS), protein E, N-terminal domain